jgi:16S rRNA (cytidine1402-2'-O)-methyltransferase
LPGRLSVVPTPIGDPDDITLRALRVLGAADVVAAEDTRVTMQLLGHHHLHPRLLSYHDHNEVDRAPELVARIQAGEHVALVSDAGTPLVNDPGWRLVRACIDAGVDVEILPGASAVITALAGAGLAVDQFYFGGFLPREEGKRRTALAELAALQATLIFYESPLRLAESLATIADLWPARQVCVARNLTKQYEQWIRGTAAEARATLGDETRGEVVLLISGSTGAVHAPADVDAAIRARLAAGERAKEIATAIAAATGLPRREVYARVLDLTR